MGSKSSLATYYVCHVGKLTFGAAVFLFHKTGIINGSHDVDVRSK